VKLALSYILGSLSAQADTVDEMSLSSRCITHLVFRSERAGALWGVVVMVDPINTTPTLFLQQAADVTGIPVARIHLLAREEGYADRKVTPCDFASMATEYDLGPHSVLLCTIDD
jgi:hypothetical protein